MKILDGGHGRIATPWIRQWTLTINDLNSLLKLYIECEFIAVSCFVNCCECERRNGNTSYGYSVVTTQVG